jgi:WD40 repeat protein
MFRSFPSCVFLSCVLLVGCSDSAPNDAAKTDTGEKAADTQPAVVSASSAGQPANAQTPANAAPQESAAAPVAPTAEPATPKDLTIAANGLAERPKQHPKPSAEQIAKWAHSDSQSLQLLSCYDGFGDGLVQCMAVSPDGTQFVLGGARLTLWNTGESEPVADLISEMTEQNVERPIRSVAISADGKYLAAGDHKGRLYVWSLADKKQILAIRAHDSRLTVMAFSPDSDKLATTSYSGEVRIWNIPDGQKEKSFKASDNEVTQLRFISNEVLATAGGEVNLWNVKLGTKEKVLTTGYVHGAALGLSNDGSRLAFADAENKIQFWETESGQVNTTLAIRGGGQFAAFSADGKLFATYSQDSVVSIWDVATHRLLQVLEADGGRTVAMQWLPQSSLLMIASEHGRVRIWGTPESAKAANIQPMQIADIAPPMESSRKPASAIALQKLMDVRTFPQLPGAEPQWSQTGMASYNASATKADAEMFYRYQFEKAGWKEIESDASAQMGLSFSKNGCVVNASFTPVPNPATGKEELYVSIHYVGNFDIRTLPKANDSQAKNVYESFSSLAYRTKGDLSLIETSLLVELHRAGWTAYTRLNAGTNEEPTSRTLTFLQAGLELIVSIGHPSDAPNEWIIQSNVSLARKTIPIPTDSGWVEFDSATDLHLVANTKLTMNEAIQFYDTQLSAEGWMAREAGRRIETEKPKAWLPYVRGQQDLLVRLVPLANGGTRVLVGEPEKTSWQLKAPAKTDPAVAKDGLEVADYALPKEAKNTKYDVDQKTVEFAMDDMVPKVCVESLMAQFTDRDWTRSKSGVMSDDYCLVSLTKGKAEIHLRVRLVDTKHSMVQIAGDGLLWEKPIPVPPELVSYGTWLRRNRFDATLDRIDEFKKEMESIPK